MSAPITEAHRKLRETLEIRWMRATELEIEQLIADSQAEAVQITMLREYGNLCATNEGIAKERDQLRAELAGEKNLHAQTRTVAEELNTICTDLRNAGGPPFIRSEAIRLLREDQATLRAEVERLKRDYEYDHKCLHEVRDRCELWKQRAERAEAELAAAKLLLNEETDCAEAVEAAIVRQYARAERAEAELANIRALANRRNKRDHAQDTTHQLVAALDQALDIAQAELAAERARLDWLRDNVEEIYSKDQHGIVYLSGDNIRAGIDAAMKEGAK
jgi:hypothetical protein